MNRRPTKKTARWTPGLQKLKAISVRQPWAWLIVNGYKDIENRIWEAKLRGRVLVHAGKSRAHLSAEELRYIKRHYRVSDLPESFDTGGIVGVVVIKDCVKRHRSKWFHGPFGWLLTDARRLPFKRCKGRLKFFNPRMSRRKP
jgi:hypothetical protein